MKKVVIFIAVVTAVAVAWTHYYPFGSWRYKITVAVDTPEGVKTGSSVREIMVYTMPPILPEVSKSSVSFRGEAVVVPIDDERTLFTTIEWDSYYDVFNAFPIEAGALTGEGIKYYRSLPVGKKAELKNPKHWPQLVTFTNLSDPKSVVSVDAKDISNVFGQGYALKRITIEITDENVNWGEVRPHLGLRHAVGPYYFVRGK